MTVQLNETELAEAVREWLTRRGARIAEDAKIQTVIVGPNGGRINIVGASAVVAISGVELVPPEGPYR